MLRSLRLAASLWLGVVGCAGLAAQGAVPPQEDGLPLLTDYPNFWGVPEADRAREHHLRFEADVLFYDPDWATLWLENDGVIFFCPVGEERYPIRSGDRVRLDCRATPTKGFVPEGLHFEVIGRAKPLQWEDATDGLPVPERFNERPVRMIGYVERQDEKDSHHLQLELVVGDYLANVIVPVNESQALPQFGGMLVELRGILGLHKGADGLINEVVVWVRGVDEIRAIGPLGADPRFALPLSPGETLRAAPSGEWVHVQGTVRGSQPGKTVTLWDESEQIVVHGGQVQPVQPGTEVTAVGRLQVDGLAISLRDALWRPVEAKTSDRGTGAQNATPLLKIRRAAQVLELAPEEAARGNPVVLLGIVTWSDPEAQFFVLQDSTRGVCVWSDGPWKETPPRVGASVQLTGRTGVGAFAPIVRFDGFSEWGSVKLPDPNAVTLNQVLGGAEEAKRVELRGFLREVKRDGRRTVFDLTTPNGEFTAKLVDAETAESLLALRGAVVRLRGVCLAQCDPSGQLTGIEVLLGTRQDIVVETPPMQVPFSAPEVPMAALRKFGPLQAPYRWLRTTGTATFVDPGNMIVVQAGDVGMEVFCRDRTGLALGQAVEVEGFPGRQGNRVVLLEAQVRPTAAAVPPVTLGSWSEQAPLNPGLDYRLVEIEARFEDQLEGDHGVHLFLRAGDVRFLGHFDCGETLRVARGSLVRCTGVYRVDHDVYGQPNGFSLQLRNAGDLVVLAPPPLLTLRHALVASAVLAAGIGGALLWVVTLRRRVKAQTRQIREHLQHEARLEAELQKAAKLESLGLLAGGIAHDFNNLLTVVMGNITLAMLEEQAMAVAGDCLLDAERGAQRAKDLTHQLLTFAKGGEPLRTAESLPEIVREAAEFVLRGSAVRCNYEFAHGLWAADVDRGQIGQVVHNLVINAMQAMPQGGVIRVTAANEVIEARTIDGLAPGRYVRLVLADTGPGMKPAVVARLFDPYFSTKKGGSGLGLATVHSIVRRHRGLIDVNSREGHGSVFRIWLPAAEGAAAVKETQVVPAPRSLQGRVLVMDDEEGIRRLVLSLLRRMGLEPVGVADGDAAIRAYRTARESGNPFSLTIMDLTVPGGMGGREAMEQLRRIDPAIRAIVSSGYSSDPVLANYREYGFAGMVEKPYEVEKLMECVARVVAESAPDGGRQSD